ncbi:hypothetical protein AVEN_180906-1 [Araneus ventricosus]|uniref:Uncharacterized protein n=1 Tax=Araneus ventricosus TaxID=182803 RepID=A0A4Y2EVF9_ARAVE|nr:hypothetical protein AVEN_222326-1 [Araneus ventricosus]GBO46495.1 hypothetical protein AVEN_180906-1 [Araneus ventricosus]
MFFVLEYWGHIKDLVLVPLPPKTLEELRESIQAAWMTIDGTKCVEQIVLPPGSAPCDPGGAYRASVACAENLMSLQLFSYITHIRALNPFDYTINSRYNDIRCNDKSLYNNKILW